ncbi:hypothetical protein [Salinicola sp. CPA57]|uniref:hypothetical protein n=1 Tax=Salinicola sp. CPA57 TaxID=1949080 RepID=UPI0013001AFD|nr:hypothetical protein [Salinicola sp. CPA57]
MLVYLPTRRHCRCRICGARQVKPKHPDEYVRGPRCRNCARVGTLRIDKWADSKPWRRHVCRCDGYHFPHREGSLWCYENPDYPVEVDRRLFA